MLCRSSRLLSFASRRVTSQAESPSKAFSSSTVKAGARKAHPSGHQKVSSHGRPATAKPTAKKSRPPTRFNTHIKGAASLTTPSNTIAAPSTSNHPPVPPSTQQDVSSRPPSAYVKPTTKTSQPRSKAHVDSKGTTSSSATLNTPVAPSTSDTPGATSTAPDLPSTHSDLLSDLHKLEAESKRSGPKEHLVERLWKRWEKLRVLPSDIWSTYSLTVLTRLVQLAGRLKGPVVLHSVAKLLKDAQDTIPHEQRILHSDGPSITPKILADPNHELLVTEWVRAEVSLGTTDWRAIQASLLATGLMPPRPPWWRVKLVASHIVEDHAEYNPKAAASLWRSFEREGISLYATATNEMCQAALRVADFGMVLDILPILNVQTASAATVELLLESLCRYGIVSLKRDSAEIIGRFLFRIADSRYQQRGRPTEPHVFWESTVLLLARSYCDHDAFHIFRMTSTFVRWSEEGTISLNDLFCDERKIGTAYAMIQYIVGEEIRRKVLHNTFLRAARLGSVLIANKCWKILYSIPAFKPSEEDLAIAKSLHEAKYQGFSSEGRGRNKRMRTRALLHDEDAQMDTSGIKTKPSNASADGGTIEISPLKRFNSALRQAMVRSGDPIRTYQVVNHKNSWKYNGTGDRVTANIVLLGAIKQHTLRSTHLRELFDMVIASGYPTEGLHLHTTTNVGQVFGSPLNLTSKEIAGYSDILKMVKDLPMSKSRHCIPLYKMFTKGFYERGDVSAGRTVLHIQRTMENVLAQKKEAKLREQLYEKVEVARSAERKATA